MNRIILTTLLVATIILLTGCAPNKAPASEQISTALPTDTQAPANAPTEPPAPTQAPPTPTSAPTETLIPPPPTPEPQPIQWEPKTVEGPCQPSEGRTCAILFVLSDKYDDEHILRTRGIFERSGYQLILASNTLEEIRGFHECYDFTPAQPDLLMQDVEVANYDAIIFTGSDNFNTPLHNDKEAHRIAQEAMDGNRVVGALGDGPVILAKAGLLKGRTVSVIYNVHMNGADDQWRNAVERLGAIYTERSPERDGLLVTADLATSKFVWGIIEVIEEVFH